MKMNKVNIVPCENLCCMYFFYIVNYQEIITAETNFSGFWILSRPHRFRPGQRDPKRLTAAKY